MERFFTAKALAGMGALLIVLSFAYDITFAGLPYQDPTPEMQARWETHKSVANWGIFSGALVFMAAATVGLIRGVVALLRRRQP